MTLDTEGFDPASPGFPPLPFPLALRVPNGAERPLASPENVLLTLMGACWRHWLINVAIHGERTPVNET